MNYGNHKMEYQEQSEPNPVIRMKPEIYPVDFHTESIFILKEVEKTSNTPASSNYGDTEYQNTDTQPKNQPVNVYI